MTYDEVGVNTLLWTIISHTANCSNTVCGNGSVPLPRPCRSPTRWQCVLLKKKQCKRKENGKKTEIKFENLTMETKMECNILSAACQTVCPGLPCEISLRHNKFCSALWGLPVTQNVHPVLCGLPETHDVISRPVGSARFQTCFIYRFEVRDVSEVHKVKREKWCGRNHVRVVMRERRSERSYVRLV